MSNKVIYATFDDEEVLKKDAQQLVDKGLFIRDVFSPFPIHGIDPIIGIPRTRIAICAFIYGMIGLSLALLGMWYFMIQDWPLIIGGKPNFTLYHNLPAFIPIAFEFTVLCAAHGMAITYLIRNQTLPGFKAKNPRPDSTDDKFVMEIRAEDNHDFTAEEIVALAKKTKAIDVEER